MLNSTNNYQCICSNGIKDSAPVMTGLCTAPCPGNSAQTVSPATIRTSMTGRTVRLTASYPHSAVPPTLSTSTVRVPVPPPRPQLNLSTSSDHWEKTWSRSRNDPDGRLCWVADRARWSNERIGLWIERDNHHTPFLHLESCNEGSHDSTQSLPIHITVSQLYR
jgi:hypothetical protein